MNELRGTLERILRRGIERQEIRPDIDVAAITTVFIATMEGAVMLSKLYQDPLYVRQAGEHLARYIDSELRSL